MVDSRGAAGGLALLRAASWLSVGSGWELVGDLVIGGDELVVEADSEGAFGAGVSGRLEDWDGRWRGVGVREPGVGLVLVEVPGWLLAGGDRGGIGGGDGLEGVSEGAISFVDGSFDGVGGCDRRWIAGVSEASTEERSGALVLTDVVLELSAESAGEEISRVGAELGLESVERMGSVADPLDVIEDSDRLWRGGERGRGIGLVLAGGASGESVGMGRAVGVGLGSGVLIEGAIASAAMGLAAEGSV